MNDDIYRHVEGVREPDPTLGKTRGRHEPATVERVPPAPVESQPEQPAKPPKRQRVVLADPRSRSTPTLRARVELEEQTSWGTLLVDDLVKRQLRAGLALAGLVLVVLGGLPLAFYLSSDFAGVHVVGVPLAWLLLGVLPFPLLLLAGLAYNRLAERHERDFVDMIEN
ncbi:hypothetical protein LWP59_00525 [Amycolatopsis acidiphila]|uniref:DUF485 domain-containing protein n=1 Tax=Amycolatopsis acidiphila TaxID=715473 RepID=A0A558AFR1_9PSEU|nr:hypothetical protein [Amycolatopsis acidiphila]TVT23094.1 hypothetical protein FNH06_10710 [Amycolatopsis acidiphila]UIJ60221.1 hypothetical protein LWP59_00525 [Amycolatopsis acidiphila]GHG60689.1 hypothetical protein GCM10017788_14600 [Amycolatopsis acidiphila]